MSLGRSLTREGRGGGLRALGGGCGAAKDFPPLGCCPSFSGRADGFESFSASTAAYSREQSLSTLTLIVPRHGLPVEDAQQIHGRTVHRPTYCMVKAQRACCER